MQGNWPIYQNHEETELQSRRCIKNGSTGPERGTRTKVGRADREEGEEEEDEVMGQQQEDTCHSCQSAHVVLVSTQLA